MDWKQIVRPLGPFLDAVATRLASQIREFDAELARYAEYALTSHGKQLRPALVGLSAGACGGAGDPHITAAVIIEMVHLATLVHDDVIDEAAVRRSRPTLAATWGNEISVLLGDCLFAHALTLASGFPTTEVCRAVATATNIVCTGEILQSHQRHRFDLTRREYIKVVSMKTGELFALSCDMGAHLCAAPPAWRKALRDYGMALGAAYQIFDDCLDVFGAEEHAGKSLGTDLIKGKITLPLLLVLEDGDADPDARRLKEMLGEGAAGQSAELLRLLNRHDILERCRKVIEEFLNRGREALSALPASPSLNALLDLTDYLDQQTGSLGQQK